MAPVSKFLRHVTVWQVHKLFGLLNLSHAYVTTLGRLVGVVALKEVRKIFLLTVTTLTAIIIKTIKIEIVTMIISNGNKTEWSPNRSVIITRD